MKSIFQDDEFRDLAVRLGYINRDDMEECVRVQHRTVGKVAKSLERIAIEKKFLTERDLDRIREGLSLESEMPEIPGYELRDVLGKGGLGTVYRARQSNMKRDVALKILHPRWVSDDEFRKRFLLEARIVGKLSHRNLIQVFDVGFNKGFYYFSMELVEGRTVHQELREGPLAVSRSIDIAIQVADAIKYLRESDLVHRDIKPSNILLTRNNVAKLSDFGFVKSRLDKQLAKEDFILGTPDYISPEQATGDEGLDYRSDVYSLGATLYHMVTGALPYDGTESVVIRQHIKAEIPRPREVKADLPERVCDVIERMMAKDPGSRYDDLDQLITDLRTAKALPAPAPAEPAGRGRATTQTRRPAVTTDERNDYLARMEILERRNRVLTILLAVQSALLLAFGLAFLFVSLLRR